MRKMEERIQVRAKDEIIEAPMTPEEMLEALKKKLVEAEAEAQRWRAKYMKLRGLVEEFYEQFFS